MRNPFRDMFKYRPTSDLVDYEVNELEKPERHANVVPVKFKNKSTRLENEYNKLKTKNPTLYKIVQELNEYANEMYDKNLLVTMIYRKQSEQDYLYRNSSRYKQRKFKSPHQFWHAIDLRSRTFTDIEIADMVGYVNSKYDDKNHYRFTADFHQVGNNGFHFHINYAKKNS